MKLGVFVGSFNPPHKGHIKIVNDLIKKNYLDKIIIVPTNEYWDKTNLASLKDRINMLKLYENDKIIIDDKNNKLKYTIEVLNSIKEYYNEYEIYLIIGADQLHKFHLWYKIDDILKYKIIVINRNDIDVKKYIDKFKNSNFIISDIKSYSTSSTDIRNGNTKYLDKKVYEYIKKNKIYEV